VPPQVQSVQERLVDAEIAVIGIHLPTVLEELGIGDGPALGALRETLLPQMRGPARGSVGEALAPDRGDLDSHPDLVRRAS